MDTATTTRLLLAAGALGAVLFVVVWSVEGATRPGYSPAQHPVSALSLGERGWVQVGSFVATGLLMGAFALGLRRVLGDGTAVAWAAVLVGAFALGLAAMLLRWFERSELGVWVDASWTFAKQIMPLLLGGVLVAGFLLGGPGSGEHGVIPNEWIARAVGGNSLSANFAASFVGAFMYFATLTEVPILEGLIQSGMGKGPALALLLAGPALSLPNMLVIRSVLGTKKTVAFIGLVVVMSTLAGVVFGAVV